MPARKPRSANNGSSRSGSGPAIRSAKPRSRSAAGAIEIRGARQNNLKGIDLDIPLGKLNVITGPSGSGKSSLAFQTVYAEGQRRYVETFSPYTRQFFERMDKPLVDDIRGIPPAIALSQNNAIRTTRSTVGTMTEINDYLKLLFPLVASAACPSCGRTIQPDTPARAADQALAEWPGRTVLVTLPVAVPQGMAPAEFFPLLQQQGYVRVLLYGNVYRTDEPETCPRKSLPAVVPVIQDRVRLDAANRSRLVEAIEAAFHLGRGRATLQDADDGRQMSFSRGWHCAACDVAIREPSPSLFSFNNPAGACPHCRGFGRTIGIDIERALDPYRTLREGAVRAMQGEVYSECEDDLLAAAKRRGVPVDVPFYRLPAADREWVLEGDPDYRNDPEAAWDSGTWYGVRGFFQYLEKRAYRMHIRVFLSRYRTYTLCPVCRGTRLRPEALLFRAGGHTLPDWWSMPVSRLVNVVADLRTPPGDRTAEQLKREVVSRLHYLNEVGLPYLNLDRPGRTLSGGEIMRVNLTACLGASLVNTLFVLDEPSVGLHPRDTARLIRVMHRLRDKGNTLLVVEHEESVIRAADNVIEIGPGRGEHGGELVYNGPVRNLHTARRSLTADYLTGRKRIPDSRKRRQPVPGREIRIRNATQNNLKDIDVNLPLGLFCCVTGVSGSGKSTLVHSILYRHLSREESEEEPGTCREVSVTWPVDRVVMVDQSPPSRTPRSTPAVYTGAWDYIREVFVNTPDAVAAGLTPGYFSFNSGNGRCGRCMGAGSEKIEMQFLSDLYVTCPECEGRRFRPEALRIRYRGMSVHDVLMMTVTEAIAFFRTSDTGRKAAEALKVLEDVGLGYLRLGQPLNTLSGGESQRLKLVGHLLERSNVHSLFILDEPTTGLHFDDITLLLDTLQRLVDRGNSLIVVEHNLEVIRRADWIVDLGPEAGEDGGRVVCEGPPEAVAACAESWTGRFLAGALQAGAGSGGDVVAEPEIDTPDLPRNNNAIVISGAREHNLRNLSVEIPRERLVVVTGLSGSGKSTLAFDIVFAEGQRRFLDSMSTYARQFVGQLEKPDVDFISGIPPSVAIEQRITRGGGKSTVSTVTEIYHFLRLLYARAGDQHCPDCGVPVSRQSPAAIADAVRAACRKESIQVMAPLIRGRKGYHTEVAGIAARLGIRLLYVDGAVIATDSFERLARYREHHVDAIVASLDRRAAADYDDIVARALAIGRGVLRLLHPDGRITVLNSRRCCPKCSRSFEDLDPRLFSFNSPYGWCPQCRGYGVVRPGSREPDAARAASLLEAELLEEQQREDDSWEDVEECPSCQGSRLNEEARKVYVCEWSIAELSSLPVREADKVLKSFTFEGTRKLIAREIMREIGQRVAFLNSVGLGYLQLDRSATTLSGGESQRIRLAAQLGSNLRGVLYVLDEPTIGLHPRDNVRLLDTLTALRDRGNSLLVVEHDPETMRRSDLILDLGPGAGMYGGQLVAKGTLSQIRRNPASVTGAALRRPPVHPVRGSRRPLPAPRSSTGWLRITGARANNLRNVSVSIPVGCLTAVCGISGSGKSSLIRGVVHPAVQEEIARRAKRGKAGTPSGGPWTSVSGADQVEAVYEVDQSPIGKTSRSIPATYIKVFDDIRNVFASVPAARMRGYTASRFSFNTEGGRCETCKGNGMIRHEMAFLPASRTVCEECGGARYNAATLEIEYNGRNIAQVMDMTITEAAEFFYAHSRIARTLQLLVDTGTGYLKLGQPSQTLSGGEAQRLKLVAELSRGAHRTAHARLRRNRNPAGNLYLIEEPTIGLHPNDVTRLIDVLHRLVDDGHTVIVIEHNTDVIAEADYVIELGPEAGSEGGRIIATGTPEEVAATPGSRTGPFL